MMGPGAVGVSSRLALVLAESLTGLRATTGGPHTGTGIGGILPGH
ncbi:hypothetical protein AB0O34_20545 [Sphaerisporangium sp. NPDC088356]